MTMFAVDEDTRRAFSAVRPAVRLETWRGVARAGASALGLVGLLACCSPRSEVITQAAETRLALPVASPVVADRAIEHEYVAEVRAVGYAQIRSRLRGIVDSVAVDEGQKVKAGEVLFTIDARAPRQELLAAKAATLTAQAELQASEVERRNMQPLLDRNVVSKAEISVLDSRIQVLKAKIEEARAGAGRASVGLGYATIKAPFAGVVNRIPHKVGSTIAEDELLTTLADTSEVYAYFRVSERELLDHAASAGERPKEVGFKLVDGRMFPAMGVVDAVESEVDKETGTIAFRARFPNPAGTLKHGSGGKVVLTTALREALLVPQKSTFEVQGELFVYVLGADGAVTARKIVARTRLRDEFVVASGLQRDERFVVEGVQKIKEGSRIDARPAGPPSHGD